MASYQKPQRLEYLDSIRGLAALAVLLSHSFLFQPPPRLDRFLLLPFINIPFNGKEAVMMFFVLSGFLLSRPYFVAAGPEQGVRRIYPPTFYLRRFTRIWLPWFFAFCLSAVAQVTIFREWRTVPPQSAGLHSLWQVPLTAGNFIWQCLFMLHDPRVQLLNQDWSLGVELKASIALPLFIFLARAGWGWCVVVLGGVALVYASAGAPYCAFMMGMFLAQYSERLLRVLRPKPTAVKVALLALGLVLYETFHIGGDWLGYDVAGVDCWAITGLGCAVILLAALASRRMQGALELRPMIFLGRVSYSVYLLQFIVILCAGPAWMHFLNGLGIYGVGWLIVLNMAAIVVMTLALSAMSYEWVEQPCIRLGHYLSKRIQARRVLADCDRKSINR